MPISARRLSLGHEFLSRVHSAGQGIQKMYRKSRMETVQTKKCYLFG